MKTPLKIIAVAVLLLAGIFSTFAQNTLLISLPAITDQSDEIVGDLIIRLEIGFEDSWFYIEEYQSLEDWMLNHEDWRTEALHNKLYAALDTDTEAELKLEDWMLSVPVKSGQDKWDFLREDIEAPLKLEDWMICKEPWCKKKSKT